MSKEAEAEASEVAIELDKARSYVLGLVERFPTPPFRVNPQATPKSLVTAAISLAEASSSLSVCILFYIIISNIHVVFV